MARPSKYSYGDFRPLRRGEGGYSPSRRQYVSPSTGEIIPLSRYQQLARGGKSYRDIRREMEKQGRAPKRYTTKAIRESNEKALFSEYYANLVRINREAGLQQPTPDEASSSVEWQLLPRYIRSKDKSPHGRLAQALVWLGRRDPYWDWQVGETPD